MQMILKFNKTVRSSVQMLGDLCGVYTDSYEGNFNESRGTDIGFLSQLIISLANDLLMHHINV